MQGGRILKANQVKTRVIHVERVIYLIVIGRVWVGFDTPRLYMSWFNLLIIFEKIDENMLRWNKSLVCKPLGHTHLVDQDWNIIKYNDNLSTLYFKKLNDTLWFDLGWTLVRPKKPWVSLFFGSLKSPSFKTMPISSFNYVTNEK